MLKHILVPLDGTRLAEAALPVAAALARTLQGRITLLHLLERDPPPAVHGKAHLQGQTDAESYLQQLRARLSAPDLPLECHVHSAPVTDVAGGIVAHQQELRPDLVVMCSHGPARLAQLLRGRLAQQVVALGQIPLLLVQPVADGEPKEFRLRRLLVPLDGTREHEGGLTLAKELARASRSQLHLLAVATPRSALSGRDATLARFMPVATRTLQQLAAENLEEYLNALVARLQGEGLAVAAELRQGHTAKVIVQTATTLDADLIVLATHGRAGTQAFWSNSVAAGVLKQTRIPLLLLLV